MKMSFEEQLAFLQDEERFIVEELSVKEISQNPHFKLVQDFVNTYKEKDDDNNIVASYSTSLQDYLTGEQTFYGFEWDAWTENRNDQNRIFLVIDKKALLKDGTTGYQIVAYFGLTTGSVLDIPKQTETADEEVYVTTNVQYTIEYRKNKEALENEKKSNFDNTSRNRINRYLKTGRGTLKSEEEKAFCEKYNALLKNHELYRRHQNKIAEEKGFDTKTRTRLEEIIGWRIANITQLKGLNETAKHVMRVDNAYPAVILTHFAKNDNYHLPDDITIPIGEYVFWELIMDKVNDIRSLTGLQYMYLFAAQYGNHEKLISYYNRFGFYRIDYKTVIKPQYDDNCISMIQSIMCLEYYKKLKWDSRATKK